MADWMDADWMDADWMELGATLAGGLLGAKNGGDKTQTTTDNKEPWAPAQPYLLDNLRTNSNMQKFYEQNPFNAQQKTSYENIYGDLNNFRSNTAPGLMDFANNAMTSGYQRPQFSAPGTAGYSRQNQSAFKPGMSIYALQQAIMEPRQQPQQQPQRSGPFSVNQGNFAMPDWPAQNPFSEQNKQKEEAAPTQLLQQLGRQALGLGSNDGGGGDYGSPSSGGGLLGGGISQEAAALKGLALSQNKALQALSPIGMKMVGLLSGLGADSAMDSAGAGFGSMNTNAALGGMAGTGIGVRSDDQGRISTFSNPMSIAEQDKANFGTSGSNGGSNGTSGDSEGSGANNGTSTSDPASDAADNEANWYKGGYVTKKRLRGPDPKGPDDGYAALDDGEYVIKASSVKKYGKGLLGDINAGRYKG